MNLKTISCIFLLVMSAVLTFCGCTQPTPVLSDGTYVTSGNETDFFQPAITFDLTDHRFSFGLNPSSSYLTAGTISVDNGYVTAATDDGAYTYIFEIKDKNTVCFVQKGSDPVTVMKGESPVTDGTEFKLTGQ